MERIGLDLGLDRATLYRWCKRFGWRRPGPPDKVGPTGAAGPHFYRSRRFGRPYGGDAVGTARDLVRGSILPVGRIAARAGVSRATVYRWMKRPGWTRHAVEAVAAAGAAGATRAIRAVRRRYRPPYGPAVVAAARESYERTELPVPLIAARIRATPERVRHWARRGGWTRPSGRPGATGRARDRT